MTKRLHLYVGIFVTFMIVVVETAVSFNSTLLPYVKADFGVDEQMVQLSVGLGLLALGCSGLVYGGLSEAYGRRPLILFGLSLFCGSTLAGSLAPNIYTLILARFAQGLGAGVGWIVGNACFKDLFHGRKYSQVMNHVHAVAGIVPVIAPIVASSLVGHIGWRQCGLLVFALAVIVVLANFFFLPETNRSPRPATPRQIMRTYHHLLTNPEYLRYGIVKVFSVMLIFCEGANIPLIFINHLGVPSHDYGFYVASVFIAYVAGSIISGYLCRVFSPDRLLTVGLLLILISNLILVVACSLADLSAAQVQAIKGASYLGWGFIFGNATACVVSAAKESPGSGSALMIALEMLFSALGIYLLGFFFNGTMLPLSYFMVAVAGACLWSFYRLRPLAPAGALPP